MISREVGRTRRHRRIRKRVVGSPDRLRLSIFRSHKHLYAQLINDLEQKTVLGCSTKALQQQGALSQGGNIPAAEQLGRLLAQEALKRGFKQIVFDRAGYRYHGRVRALAEALRQGGVEL